MDKSEDKLFLDMHDFLLIFLLSESVDLEFYNKTYPRYIENGIKCPTSYSVDDKKDIELVVLKWLGRTILECHTHNMIRHLHSSSNSVCF